jgi:hypothetical protein
MAQQMGMFRAPLYAGRERGGEGAADVLASAVPAAEPTVGEVVRRMCPGLRCRRQRARCVLVVFAMPGHSTSTTASGISSVLSPR